MFIHRLQWEKFDLKRISVSVFQGDNDRAQFIISCDGGI
ncbi:hypothetical protein SEEM842_11123 [Salmonella enterica subsp. enterica serovar Senftenberg str. 423984-2]|nr:hypothetical protein SEEM841_20397 [Salmonella enterica subsp. enterica serovar Senftenberg str. 423984-1]ESC02530.1 hypothetical protein SEES004_12344 [Salmonella enterica subsp. enterica serovar Senftenberg str. 361154004]ESC88819.1 hypothetical protein SEEM038_14524 [Salmonella enterica subsp. enterica serovar Senftenberg str. NC_MB012510-0038]ESG33395.1 hypothetical protein SEEM842_11123 [Salmonella enterica subsp. enterica serovar Senftenberg str. 423984-2]ESG57036.1 hypothetical protei